MQQQPDGATGKVDALKRPQCDRNRTIIFR